MKTFQGRDMLEHCVRGGLRRPTALLTLMRTQGASFRKAGARMLVGADGSRTGVLAGGCPEADLVAHAQEAMSRGRPRLVTYDREHGWDAMLEAGCGGELEVLIEPLEPRACPDWIPPVLESLAHRVEGQLVTHYRRCFDDPQPRRRMDPARPVGAANPDADAHASAYGVLIEALIPRPRLVVIGLSAVADSLVAQGRLLGWETVRVEPREERSPARAPAPLRTTPGALVDVLRPDAATAVVVMTHQLELDLAYLQALAAAPLAYLGAIGSRRRNQGLRERIPGLDDSFHGPAGLDLGGETPELIALAITAEIVATAHRKSGRPLKDLQTSIH